MQQIGELSRVVMHHLHNCFITKARAEVELEQLNRTMSLQIVCAL